MTDHLLTPMTYQLHEARSLYQVTVEGEWVVASSFSFLSSCLLNLHQGELSILTYKQSQGVTSTLPDARTVTRS